MVQERPDAFEPGDRLGPYEFVAALGRGTFGAVYEVRRGVLRTHIALKVLHAKWRTSPQIVARFQREARAIAALRHKNIVAVHDLTQVEGQHVIEMELLRGESLGERLKRARRLSTEEALDVLLPIISGVQAAHDLDLVHRDLKPENILLARESDGSEVPKLLDFGVVHMVEDGVESMTGVDQQIGTPSYMSPEQFRADEVIDGRSDQWSLAVILYVMLTGRRPFFAKKNLLQTRLLIECFPAAPLRDAGVVVPETLEAALFRALRKSREERYPSVRDFGAALVPFARGDARARFGALWGVANDLGEPTTTRFPMPLLTLDEDDHITVRRPAMLRRELAEAHVAESELPSAAPVVVPSALERTQQLPSKFRSKAAIASALFGAVLGLVLFGSWWTRRDRRAEAPRPTAVTQRSRGPSPSPPRPEVEVRPVSPSQTIEVTPAVAAVTPGAEAPRESAPHPPRSRSRNPAEPAAMPDNLWNRNPYDLPVEVEGRAPPRESTVPEQPAPTPSAPPPTQPPPTENTPNRPGRWIVPISTE